CSNGQINADMDATMKLHALASHLLDPPLHMMLLDLEIGDAVAHQPARAALAFMDMYLMTCACKLLGCGESRRTRANDRDFPAGPGFGGVGPDITCRNRPVSQRLLDILDRDRNIFEVERARLFARRGTDPPGPFRKIIGRMQVTDRLVPVAPVYQIVPVGNLVMYRAAGRSMAIGHAAIHAACGLLGHFRLGHRQYEFPEVPDPVRCRLILRLLPF